VKPEESSKNPSAKSQLGILFSPKNFLKTLASQFPFASAGVEALNQLDGAKIEDRVTLTEHQLKNLATARPSSPAPATGGVSFQDWSFAAGEFMRRNVHFAIAYDASYHSRRERGQELIQRVAHGCLVGPGEVLTCKEALQVVDAVVQEKRGRAVILSGFATYDFVHEQIDEGSGLVLCKLSGRDETKWRRMVAIWKKNDLSVPPDESRPLPVRASVMPWIGQEIGFIHEGEASDISMVHTFSPLQFDLSTISHFRRANADGLKIFVSGVLPGRILRTGSAVFGRDATILGVIADTQSFPSDAGRRAIVRSLLGHPRFTTFTSKDSQKP
jgi:hypothetical protein